jgi:hypothetical protein
VKGGEQAHGEFDHLYGMRNDQGFTSEASEPMALTAVVLFDPISKVFADVMFANWQSALIRAVIVGAIQLDIPSFQPFRQAV